MYSQKPNKKPQKKKPQKLKNIQNLKIAFKVYNMLNILPRLIKSNISFRWKIQVPTIF